MADESKWKQWLTQLNDRLNEQVWFQQLKAKWDELDPQSKLYLKFAGLGASALLVAIFALSSMWHVHSLKTEIEEKMTLNSDIQKANATINEIRMSMPQIADIERSEAKAPDWNSYFQSAALTARIEPSSLEIGSTKAGNSAGNAKESLLDLKLNHVNVKQLVRYAVQIEAGNQPVKLRHLVIDAQDPEGYLNAVLSVSTFELKG